MKEVEWNEKESEKKLEETNEANGTSKEPTKTERYSLLLYTLLSAVGLVWLVFPGVTGIGVVLFGILQFILLFLLAPKRKALWMFVPIFLILSNYLFSANLIWRLTNPLVLLCLFAAMYLQMTGQFPFWKPSMEWLGNLVAYLFVPLKYILLPFRWLTQKDGAQKKVLLRVLLGLALALPCVCLLAAVLSSADAVFYRSMNEIFDRFSEWLTFGNMIRWFTGILGGCYLFCLLYAARISETFPSGGKERRFRADLLILNLFLGAVLAVYTLFVFIQFKYLFTQAALPFGLTYSAYARKGFFELLFLSGVNILLILLTVRLGREKAGTGKRITQWLSCYLCAVTLVLLASSFYRMWLYCNDAGLTRLRFLVFGFLIFESLALLCTFVYIFRPTFHMVSVYLAIGLVYYTLLNVVPMDYMIAKNQIDRYLSAKGNGIAYTLTLSDDAAPQVKRLLDAPAASSEVKAEAEEYFQQVQDRSQMMEKRWQWFQFSTYRAEQVRRVLHEK